MDDEELLSCPQNESNISLCPDEVSHKPDSIHIGEFRDDLVTTTTPEPTTSKPISNEAEATTTEYEYTYASSRSALKRTSETNTRRDSEEDPSSVPVDTKKLRVDAPEFVPSREVEQGDYHKLTNVAESMSHVSTSSTLEGTPDEDIASSDIRLLDTTDTSIGLSIAADDELDERESTEESQQQLPTCSSQSTGENAMEEAGAEESASSTGLEDSDVDYPTSRRATTRKPGLLALPEFETEDSDEGNERHNPKHHVERDNADGKLQKLLLFNL